jgi:hypothetical protein
MRVFMVPCNRFSLLGERGMLLVFTSLRLEVRQTLPETARKQHVIKVENSMFTR